MVRLSPSIPLGEDTVIPAEGFSPELTLFADGTEVWMKTWDGGRKGKRGVTFGRSVTSSPHPYQAVRWMDGTEDHVAPHVLSRA